jgi:putative transposase
MQETRRAYSTDVSDGEWANLAPDVPLAKPGGRPPKHTRRELINAIYNQVPSGLP